MTSSPDRPTRPFWATGLSLFCVGTLVFLIYRDLFIPEVRDVEVWFGFEVHGALAWATAPLHWVLFALGAVGFARFRPWIWPWASIYGFYIATSHLIWNFMGGGAEGLGAGLTQLFVFSIPAVALLWAKPPPPPSKTEAASQSTTIAAPHERDRSNPFP